MDIVFLVIFFFLFTATLTDAIFHIMRVSLFFIISLFYSLEYCNVMHLYTVLLLETVCLVVEVARESSTNKTGLFLCFIAEVKCEVRYEFGMACGWVNEHKIFWVNSSSPDHVLYRNLHYKKQWRIWKYKLYMTQQCNVAHFICKEDIYIEGTTRYYSVMTYLIQGVICKVINNN